MNEAGPYKSEVTEQTTWYMDPAGRLDMNKLLAAIRANVRLRAIGRDDEGIPT